MQELSKVGVGVISDVGVISVEYGNNNITVAAIIYRQKCFKGRSVDLAVAVVEAAAAAVILSATIHLSCMVVTLNKRQLRLLYFQFLFVRQRVFGGALIRRLR